MMRSYSQAKQKKGKAIVLNLLRQTGSVKGEVSTKKKNASIVVTAGQVPATLAAVGLVLGADSNVTVRDSHGDFLRLETP